MEDNRWNRVRFEPTVRGGHVESFFFVGQDPAGERALWIRATILAPKGAPQDAEASAWVVGVERSGRVWGLKDSASWCEGHMPCGRRGPMQAAGLTVTPDRIQGTISGGGRLGRGAKLDVTLSERSEERLALLFHDALYELPWPSFKLVTPAVRLSMAGSVEAAGRVWKLDGWTGMQGHNWGRRHADRYGWVFCNTWDGRPDEALVVEAFSLPGTGPAHRLVGGLAGAVVSYQGRTLEFNGPVQLVRNRAWSGALAWGMKAQGRAGRLTLRFWARPERTACLRYRNPDGTQVLCANSPLASADFVLELPDGKVLRRRSARAVLELAGPSPVPGVEILA